MSATQYTGSNQYNTPNRSTESILNSDFWMDGMGTVTPIVQLEDDHLRNILLFIYKSKDRYWVKCHDTSFIKDYKNGEEFFQHVIVHSTLWTSILDHINRPETSFNFEFSIPGVK
ncbi:hypothetical protein ATZ33_17325 [Enterococcus silesiacus]|nr:hypothetical protein ATZ33_17325 [Enterococcus silesiacus]